MTSIVNFMCGFPQSLEGSPKHTILKPRHLLQNKTELVNLVKKTPLERCPLRTHGKFVVDKTLRLSSHYQEAYHRAFHYEALSVGVGVSFLCASGWMAFSEKSPFYTASTLVLAFAANFFRTKFKQARIDFAQLEWNTFVLPIADFRAAVIKDGFETLQKHKGKLPDPLKLFSKAERKLLTEEDQSNCFSRFRKIHPFEIMKNRPIFRAVILKELLSYFPLRSGWDL